MKNKRNVQTPFIDKNTKQLNSLKQKLFVYFLDS